MGNAEWGMGQLDDYYNGGLECIVDPIPHSPFPLAPLRRVVDPRLGGDAALGGGDRFGLDVGLLHAVVEFPQPRLFHERVEGAHPRNLQADHAVEEAAMDDEVAKEP